MSRFTGPNGKMLLFECICVLFQARTSSSSMRSQFCNAPACYLGACGFKEPKWLCVFGVATVSLLESTTTTTTVELDMSNC